MVTETVKKGMCQVTCNKYNEITDKKFIPIEFELEYDENNLLPMCKDLIEIIKDKNIFAFSIVSVNYMKWIPDIGKFYWDFQYVKKIVFDEYYLTVDGFKIFYNAIFKFSEERKW